MPPAPPARNGRPASAGQSAPQPVVSRPAIFQGPPAARRRRLTPGRVLAAVLAVVLIAFVVTRFVPSVQEQAQPEEQEQQADESSQEQTPEQTAAEPKTWDTQTEQTFTFVDSGGTSHTVQTNFGALKSQYDRNAFSRGADGKMTYTGPGYTSKLGIDVSSDEGTVDWKAVKAAGYDFAILQVGYRGYESGAIGKDDYFETNYEGARAAGLQVGAYFFSQAVNDAEAQKEADSALEMLDGKPLDLPVMYDPEFVMKDKARANNVSAEQLTNNALIFCNAVKNGGYDAGVYATLMWEAYEFDLQKLASYPIWCADYVDKPQTPYAFKFWQYSYKTAVPGVTGTCDVNVMMIPKEGQS